MQKILRFLKKKKISKVENIQFSHSQLLLNYLRNKTKNLLMTEISD